MTKKPVIVDQRAADLHKVDGEIARLGKQKTEKQALFKADTDKHPLDQNMDLQKRLSAEISTIAGLIEQLRDKRFKIEIGDAESAVAPKSNAAPVQHRPWDIDQSVLGAGLPDYPDVIRGSAADDGNVFPDTLDAMRALYRAAAFDHFRKYGCHPDQLVELETSALHMGEIHAIIHWFSHRCMALEVRVKELEERPSVEYRGVWRSTQQYQRGSLVTHDGSIWHADVASTGLMPGDGAAGWRLAVKRGRDGKDAR